MKLVHLNPHYAIRGGIERYVTDVSDALDAAGHDTAVIYSEATGDEPKSARAAYHVPGLGGPHAAPTAGALARLETVLAATAPDVVVVHGIVQPEVARVATAIAPSLRLVWDFRVLCPGRSRVLARSGEVCMRPVGLGCQLVAWSERCMPRNPGRGLGLIARTRRLADVHRRRSEIMVPSAFMRGLCLADGFPAERVHVVAPFTATVPADAPATSIAGRIFCPARLVPEKGVDHLVRALVRVPAPAHLVVAGEGSAREMLVGLARQLGVADRVRFTGWLDGAALAAAYRDAEIVVVPSTWPEPFGMVGIEAMAYGRPVIGCDVGGIREWLAPEVTGLLVPPRDSGALAGALVTLRQRPELRTTLGAEGRRVVVREFSAAPHVRRFLEVAERARHRWTREHARGA